MEQTFESLQLKDGYYTLKFKNDQYYEYILIQGDTVYNLYYDPELRCWELCKDTEFGNCKIISVTPTSKVKIEWMDKCISTGDYFFDSKGNISL